MAAEDLLPFRVDVPESDLVDLRDRLARTRWAPEVPGARADDWSRGVPADALRAWAARWAEDDWRRHEARLNGVDQLVTEVEGQRIHLLHHRSPDPEAVPLLLTHGWPGSVWEFLDVLDPFAAPGPGACHVIAPSLPGYGWSSPLSSHGWGPDRVADAWAVLMERLGYETYVAQGGDWGSVVSRRLAVRHSHRVRGLHLSMHAPRIRRDADLDGLTDRELAHLERRRWFAREGRGYHLLQATRPDTIGHALTDSPVGQLAWVLEKLHDWTDPALPLGGIEEDVVLANLWTYWLTRTASSSAQFYYEDHHQRVDEQRCPVPTAMLVLPHDIAPAVRRFSEPGHDLVRWTELDAGGHFASLEQPEAYVADVRAFVSSL